MILVKYTSARLSPLTSDTCSIQVSSLTRSGIELRYAFNVLKKLFIHPNVENLSFGINLRKKLFINLWLNRVVKSRLDYSSISIKDCSTS